MHEIRAVRVSHGATPEMKVQASLRDATDSCQPTPALKRRANYQTSLRNEPTAPSSDD
jgi:hypothetical protein